MSLNLAFSRIEILPSRHTEVVCHGNDSKQIHLDLYFAHQPYNIQYCHMTCVENVERIDCDVCDNV